MLTLRGMKYLMIVAGLTASTLVGAAAQAATVSFGTNGGSYSFSFDNDGGARASDPQTTSDPTASYARAPLLGAPRADKSAPIRSDRTTVGTNGGSYYLDH